MRSTAVTVAPVSRHHVPAGEKEDGPALQDSREIGSGIADVAILTMHGILQHKYGRHDEALAACNAAVRACPDYPPAHAGRGRVLAGLGRPDEALDAFCDAIACDPECAPAHADYALAVTRLGCYNGWPWPAAGSWRTARTRGASTSRDERRARASPLWSTSMRDPRILRSSM